MESVGVFSAILGDAAQLTIGMISAVMCALCLAKHGTDSPSSYLNASSAIDEETAKEVKESGATLMEQLGKTVIVHPKPATGGAAKQSYSVEEIRKHNKVDDLWIIVRNEVYDITKFVHKHPGGWLPLKHLAGKDATDAMDGYHPAKVFSQMLPAYHIGSCNDCAVAPWTKDFRDLRQSLLRDGLFDTSISYYAFLTIWNISLFFMAISFLFPACQDALNLSPPVATVISAVVFGIFTQQVTLLGHDAAHSCMSHDSKLDCLYGYLMLQPAMGVSIAWWKHNHNTHHIISNSVDHDPDIQHWPVFCVSDKFFTKRPAEGIWSTFYRKYIGKIDSIAWVILGAQHWLFYPVMGVARFNLYAQSIRHILLEDDKNMNQKKELMALAFYFTWITLLCVYAVPAGYGLIYLLLSHAVAGILNVQICLNHFSMPVFRGEAYTTTWDESKQDDWWALQLTTTLNVDCPAWIDWFHGGLQFQIIHHLFPRMPRHNLRYVVPRVKEICARHSLPFYEPSFFRANVDLIETLYVAALQVRTATGSKSSCTNMLWEGMCAHG